MKENELLTASLNDIISENKGLRQEIQSIGKDNEIKLEAAIFQFKLKSVNDNTKMKKDIEKSK